MKLHADEVVRALQANVVGAIPREVSYALDTRTLQPGETYIALRGERFDGHDYLVQAQERGAAAAIVERADALPPGLPGFVVAQTHIALQALAALARTHFCGAVIAITGSAGKTTTKEFLAQILRAALNGGVAASPANENNEIGVSKVLLNLEREAAAVIEMGARHFGDIAPLVAIARPNIAILTNIAQAHLAVFGTLERLATTKWQLFSGGARAILSLGDVESMARYTTLAEVPFFAGIAADQKYARDLPSEATTLILYRDHLEVRSPHGIVKHAECVVEVPGDHNLRNLALASAAAYALGISVERIAGTLGTMQLPAGRYERRPGRDGTTVIHDAYNASPSGTLASLATFAHEPAQRRIVVLGSMAELGDFAPEAHRRVGAAIAQLAPVWALLGGAHAAELEAGAVATGLPSEQIKRYVSNAEAIELLRSILRPGDVVFVKGSRMYRLEEVVEALSEPTHEPVA